MIVPCPVCGAEVLESLLKRHQGSAECKRFAEKQGDPKPVKPGSCSCGGVLERTIEGEMVCSRCGTVVREEGAPLMLNPYDRSPLNHGVVGKNLGTCQRVLYMELRRAGQVSGVVQPWDLDRIAEQDDVMRKEVMWFTNLVLKLGFEGEGSESIEVEAEYASASESFNGHRQRVTGVDVDPLARQFRATVKNIQDEERREMERRVRIRLSSLHRQYEQYLAPQVARTNRFLASRLRDCSSGEGEEAEEDGALEVVPTKKTRKR